MRRTVTNCSELLSTAPALPARILFSQVRASLGHDWQSGGQGFESPQLHPRFPHLQCGVSAAQWHDRPDFVDLQLIMKCQPRLTKWSKSGARRQRPRNGVNVCSRLQCRSAHPDAVGRRSTQRASPAVRTASPRTAVVRFAHERVPDVGLWSPAPPRCGGAGQCSQMAVASAVHTAGACGRPPSGFGPQSPGAGRTASAPVSLQASIVARELCQWPVQSGSGTGCLIFSG
jgi:hypothetical protein